MKLIFEKSRKGRGSVLLPPLDVPETELKPCHKREKELHLEALPETDISRHYTELADRVYGVNNGFYPLGSCTMKYNPKVNDEMAALPGFVDIHPLQPADTVQGALKVISETEKLLGEITGMDYYSLQPAAGAHGEFTGLKLIRAYHEKRGDVKRTKIIVPDSAHGTNPASAAMAGFEVVNIASTEKGFVDVEALKKAVGEDTAGFMLTNPNTLGLFDENILEITQIIHDAGGLNYYDGANLNAIMGIARPGDMGFDVMHLNLHKTFSTPHGGGGPGSGPVGCKEILAPFLPVPRVKKDGDSYVLSESAEDSIGRVRGFNGNFLTLVRALTYILTLGADGVKASSQSAVLAANYLMENLKDTYLTPFTGPCMHEFVISLEELKKETGVSALDMAKALLDYGVHPPTMYFPLIVHEAFMLEPTETESRENLDKVIAIYKELYERAKKDPEDIKNSPKKTVIGRPDEVMAARTPVIRYDFTGQID